jgi:hypothetical protein
MNDKTVKQWHNQHIKQMNHFINWWNIQQDKTLFPKQLKDSEWDEQYHFFCDNVLSTNKSIKSVGIYNLSEVLDYAVSPNINKKSNNIRKMYGEYNVKMNSKRYWVFKHKGVKCVNCDITGNFFSLDEVYNYGVATYHFNLFAGDPNKPREEWIMITKDHILPASKGGNNSLNNLQPMCKKCNEIKADKI